jgi:hypothetical protein
MDDELPNATISEKRLVYPGDGYFYASGPQATVTMPVECAIDWTGWVPFEMKT